MLSVITWKWRSKPTYHTQFAARHVNVLRSMVARHCGLEHRFICVTDDPSGIDTGIEIVPLWHEHADLPNPMRRNGPSCYRRLRAFAADAEQLFGPRFVSLDLDTVIVGDLTPLWDRPEDFMIWGDTSPGTPYNGSMFLMTAGARRRVWDEFDPIRSPTASKQLGYFGSDQGWIAACLGPKERKWTYADGVISFRNEIQNRKRSDLPPHARIVFFHGRHKPWDCEVQKEQPWIAAHWH